MRSEVYSFQDWQDGKAPPKGWDAADAVDDGWGKPELDSFMRAMVRPWTPKTAAEPAGKAEERPLPAAGPVPMLQPPRPATGDDADEFKRIAQQDTGETSGKPRALRKPDAAAPDGALSGPAIHVAKGFVHKAVDGAIEVLSNPSLGIYARGDDLVRAVSYRAPGGTLTVAKQSENISRPDNAVVIATLPEAALVETLTRHARFMKWSPQADKFVPCDCPPEVARMILAKKGHDWTVPRLRAVISAPTLRPDSSLITEAGYDAATGLLLVGDRLWRQVPEQPTKRDALRALDVLVEPIDALPFVDNSDRAAAVALLITSVMRPCLRTAPMFVVTAPAAGTGKSLAIDVAAVIATGRRAAVVTPTPDEAELEKRIGASALAGDQIISIDNVTHVLRSDQLCQMLTQDEVQVRVLGASKNIRVPSTALICATGNNLAIHGDLNRRVIRIRLDAQCERPDERAFKFDACEMALRKRPELVAAALTIVRAYLVAGAPGRASPMGSFEDWSNTVRSPLIWLEMGDCRGNVELLRADDPEKTELAEIIAALPIGEFTARQVAAQAASETEMRETFEGFVGRNGTFSTKKFGWYLKRHAGTRIGGRWIEQVRNDGAPGAIWSVRKEGDW